MDGLDKLFKKLSFKQCIQFIHCYKFLLKNNDIIFNCPLFELYYKIETL
jgi:hypothetical protein